MCEENNAQLWVKSSISDLTRLVSDNFGHELAGLADVKLDALLVAKGELWIFAANWLPGLGGLLLR